jgi:hypothetical protein
MAFCCFSAWQTAPFATVLSDIQKRVEQLQVGQTHVAPLYQQAVLDTCILLSAISIYGNT